MLKRLCNRLRLCTPASSTSTVAAFSKTAPDASDAGGATIGGNTDLDTPESLALDENQDVATFAAGCFWGVELAFQRVHGVVDTKVGYTQGRPPQPTYKQVCSGKSGHAEAVRVVFDTRRVTYPELLALFWAVHDPTTLNRQKNDIGTQYRSGVYFHSEQQREQANASRAEQQKLLRKPILTEILAAKRFWLAESYHQRYLEKGGQCADKGCGDMIRCYG